MGKVSPLALAVLGLLGERPRHPYEVAFVMRRVRGIAQCHEPNRANKIANKGSSFVAFFTCGIW